MNLMMSTAPSRVGAAMRYGPLSFFFGGLSLLCAIAASQLTLLRVPGSARILQWFDEHGLIAPSVDAQAIEISAPSLFLVTDGRAIEWAQIHSWWWAAAAMVLALVSVRRREPSLYSSTGFLCGGLALMLSDLTIGMCIMLVGSAFAKKLRPR